MKIKCNHLAAAILAVGLALGAGSAMAQGGFVQDGPQAAPAPAPGLSPQAQQAYNEAMGKLFNAQQALNAKQDQLSAHGYAKS